MIDREKAQAAVAAVRDAKGDGFVEARRRAEDQARALLEAKAGQFGADDLRALFDLFRTDATGDTVHAGRFEGSFSGFHATALIDNLAEVNDRLARLWGDDAEASRTAQSMLRNDGRLGLPMGGQSFPTMVLYVKEPTRFAVAQSVVTRGCRALGVNTTYNRGKGWVSYLGWCESAQAFASEFGLAISEVDAVFAHADPGPPVVQSGSGAQRMPPAEVPERRCEVCFQMKRVGQFLGDAAVCTDCL
jgi:hypothetical protein